MQYDTNTAYSIAHSGSIDFPTVALCATATVGKNISSFVLYCSYNGQPCSSADFLGFRDPHGTYKDCWNFNFQTNNLQTSSKPGPEYGLQLLLDVDSAGANNNTLIYGLVVSPHSPMKPSLPSSEGVLVPPGSISFVSLRRNEIANLKKPYGLCADTEVGYSMTMCLDLCGDKLILASCGCVPRPSTLSSVNSPTCTRAYDSCVNKARSTFATTANAESCGCPISCSDVTFDMRVSSAAFNTDSVNLRAMAPPPIVKQGDAAFINWLKTRVFLYLYYEELNTISIEQQVAQDFPTFFGNLGGLLGLLLGMSFMTLFEFVEYSTQMCTLCCCSRRRGGKVGVQKNQNNNEEGGGGGASVEIASPVKTAY